VTRWTILLAAVASEVTASLALKGALHHRWLYVVVVLGYLAAFVLLMRVLRTGMPLGVAYGVWAAMGVAFTAVLAAVLFGEQLTSVMGIGLALLIAGILLVELGSHRAEQPAMRAGRRGA
jgi:small multidrug resistance pump